MRKEDIVIKMKELEKIIHHNFKNISWLCKAMKSIKIGNSNKKNPEYKNEGLATVGDAVLKTVITDYLYRKGIRKKGELSTQREDLEKNETLFRVAQGEHILNYAYNNKHFNGEENIPDHEKVHCPEHDSFIEAIIGAMFYDSSYITTRRWILKYLIPLLEQYKS